MRYIGPDYNDSDGIVLPGMDEPLDPKSMSDDQINQLISYFPHLAPYFDAAINENPNTGSVLVTPFYKTVSSLQNIIALQNAQSLRVGRLYETNDISPPRFFIGLSNNTFREVFTDAENSDKNFVHNQSSASAIWTINHPLNKRASVTVVDSASTEVEGEVIYVSDSTIEIRFTAAFSGKAYLN